MARILLVEDDDHQRLLYEQELTAEGYEVLAVGTGAEALESIKANPIDLVVLDLRLPDKDGIEILGRIAAANENLPVIINSAYGVWKGNFRSWLAEAYVIKSSNLDELKIAIRRALKKWHGTH